MTAAKPPFGPTRLTPTGRIDRFSSRRHRIDLQSVQRISTHRGGWPVDNKTGFHLPDIFLSYGHGDEATARRFAESFEREGFSVWWDASLRSGDAFDAAIEAALRSAKAVVVLWSTISVQSRWVRAEATLAERNKTLMPVMIELCDRPIMFELMHTTDLCHWIGDPATWSGRRTFPGCVNSSRRLGPIPLRSPKIVSQAPELKKLPAPSTRRSV